MAAVNLRVVLSVPDQRNGNLGIHLLLQNLKIVHLVNFLLVGPLAPALVLDPYQNGYMENEAQEEHAESDERGYYVLGRVQDV